MGSRSESNGHQQWKVWISMSSSEKNADPLWLHQNEMWEYIQVDEEDK